MHLPEWASEMDQLAAARLPFLFILDFNLAHPIILRLSSDGRVMSEDDQSSKVRFSFYQHHESHSAPVSLQKYPVLFDTYQQGFDQVMRALHGGDTYLLNLCYTTRLEGIDSLEEIYHSAVAPYKLWLPEKFVLFSPEQFVEIKNGIIRTYPMKGTIDANLPDAQRTLLDDIKEQEEHATVVDLLRNDLCIVAHEVTVNRYRYITEIKTGDRALLQCSSEISGVLDDHFLEKPGSIMHAILPAGSVTGAPKKKTVELITAIEPEPRDYFTGVFGVFDGKNLDSAVMIRMIEQRPDGFYYRSGGGITYRSIPAQEYQEMIDKVYIPG